jgi:uncharacterized protein YbjT (DUF2867 family)
MAKILSYGATGSQGEPVARKLLEAGHQVRVVVRHPEKAAALAALGAEVVQGDLSDVGSLQRASQGIERVFLMYPFSAGGNPFELLGNALQAARGAGVGHLVFNTSGHPPTQATGIPMLDGRIAIEQLIQNSGVPSVLLRPGVYMENFLGPWCLPSIQNANTVTYPHRDAMQVSWIASEDLGSLAVAALERPELAGQAFTIGGPQAMNGQAVAEAFSVGLGRDIKYQAISPEAFGATMAQMMGAVVGEGIRQGYAYSNAQPDNTMAVNMKPILEVLPVTLTPLVDWVKKHRVLLTNTLA